MLQGFGRWKAFTRNLFVDEVCCKSNTTLNVYIKVQAEFGEKTASNFVIKQNKSTVLQSATGEFLNVDMSLFKPGAKIVAYIEFADGTKSKEVELLIRNYNVIR
jgi:hypothetical protein